MTDEDISGIALTHDELRRTGRRPKSAFDKWEASRDEDPATDPWDSVLRAAPPDIRAFIEEHRADSRPWADRFSDEEQAELWLYCDPNVPYGQPDLIRFPFRLRLIAGGRNRREWLRYQAKLQGLAEKARIQKVVGDSGDSIGEHGITSAMLCVDEDNKGLCSSCRAFLVEVSPTLKTETAIDPTQKEVAVALSVEPRTIRRRMERLGIRSWRIFVRRVREWNKFAERH